MKILKSLIIGLFALSLPISLMAQGIDFQSGTWADIQAKAAEADKPIFVDAYTTWCGPCKWMSANLFPDAAVGDYFNEAFIPYKLDMEKGEGLTFAKTYNVVAYPTLIFVDAEGNLLHKAVGTPQTTEGLIEVGQAATNPDLQLYSLKNRYDAGDKSPETARTYALTLQRAYEEGAGEVADTYLQSQAPESWSSPENFAFIKEIIQDYTADPFRYVVNHQADFAKQNPAEEVQTYIDNVLAQAIYGVMRQGPVEGKKAIPELEATYTEILGEEAAKGPIARLHHMFDMQFGGDMEASHPSALAYLDQYSQNPFELNQAAWQYYEKTDNKILLRDALRWVNKSIELDRNTANLDTRAALLYKLEVYGEAKISAEETIALAEELEEDADATKELLEKINAALANAPVKERK